MKSCYKGFIGGAQKDATKFNEKGFTMDTVATVADFEVEISKAVSPVSDFAKELAQAADEKIASKTSSGIKGLMEGRFDTFRVNPFVLRKRDGLNSRDFSLAENQEHVDQIAQDMTKNGYDESKPILVSLNKAGELDVIDGECRWRAAIRAINVYGAEFKVVPVVTAPKGLNDADLIALTRKANTAKRFNDLEDAEVVRKLLAFRWANVQIAEKTGMQVARVARLISILELPEMVKTMIRDGEVSATYALEVHKDSKSDAETLDTLKKGLEQAQSQGKTKVVKKDVAKATNAVRVSPGAVVKGLKEVFKVSDVRKDDGRVSFTFDADTAARVKELLGLDIEL